VHDYLKSFWSVKNKNTLPSVDIKHEFTVCIDAFEVFAVRVSFKIFKAVKSNVHVWALSKWCTLRVFLEENTNSSSQERSQFNVTFPLRLMVSRRERADAEVKTEK